MIQRGPGFSPGLFAGSMPFHNKGKGFYILLDSELETGNKKRGFRYAIDKKGRPVYSRSSSWPKTWCGSVRHVQGKKATEQTLRWLRVGRDVVGACRSSEEEISMVGFCHLGDRYDHHPGKILEILDMSIPAK